MIVRRVWRLVDAHKTGIFRIAAQNRVILELAEMTRESDVLGARDVLIAEEQYLVRQQQPPDSLPSAPDRATQRRSRCC